MGCIKRREPLLAGASKGSASGTLQPGQGTAHLETAAALRQVGVAVDPMHAVHVHRKSAGQQQQHVSDPRLPASSYTWLQIKYGRKGSAQEEEGSPAARRLQLVQLQQPPVADGPGPVPRAAWL